METWDFKPVPAHDLTALIDPSHPKLTIAHQAKLLGIARQSYYYRPSIDEAETVRLKRHLDAVDAIYTDYPFYGSRRVQVELERKYGITIGRDRIRHLMQRLGLEAIYPGPNTSKPSPGHEIYPYLLKGLKITEPNQVWGTDITYIRTEEGFVYLVAFLDWHSRYVISWQLADSLDNSFVLQALRDALEFMTNCGLGAPDICNSDQGSHFTSEAYLRLLEQAGIQISMDGRGRCMDNIFTERLWRSVKYENVFLSSYKNLADAKSGINEYIQFYNHKRWHQSLDYRTPASVYFSLRDDQ